MFSQTINNVMTKIADLSENIIFFFYSYVGTYLYMTIAIANSFGRTTRI